MGRDSRGKRKGVSSFIYFRVSTVTACLCADGNGTPEIEKYLCKKSREWGSDINERADAMDSNGPSGCWP